MFHGLLFLVGTQAWDDPLSFRKATLFGISTGFTLWSCLWAQSYLKSHRSDAWIRAGLCGALVAEVILIAMQTWRGQASHFNRQGGWNASIETLMLVCITIAMLAIVTLSLRAWTIGFRQDSTPAVRSAIRSGLLFLCLSGVIGYGITYIGNELLRTGSSPERWGDRGVLKFPHGAALHAIQTLAIIAWFADRQRNRQSLQSVRLAAGAHASWLLYPIYQTVRGKERFELDSIGIALLLLTILLSVGSAAMLMTMAPNTEGE
jgi:hypothetical protein